MLLQGVYDRAANKVYIFNSTIINRGENKRIPGCFDRQSKKGERERERKEEARGLGRRLRCNLPLRPRGWLLGSWFCCTGLVGRLTVDG